MPALIVAAWVVFWNPASIATFGQRAASLDEALVEWVGVDEKGTPFRRPRTPEQETALRAAARSSGTRLYGMASNFALPGGFDPERMSLMLNDPAKRKAHTDVLAGIAKEDALAGIDLDYESLKAADRDEFSLFVRELAAVLHRGRRKLSVTVHPKQNDDGGWSGPQAQDYAAIGRAADVVRVMAYDFSYSESVAGPIAPDDWVRRVGAYAKSRIPARKVSLGIPCYGYDWGRTPGASLTWEDYLAVRSALPGAPASETAADSGEESVGAVRFGGAASFARKAAIARELGLGGVSFWYIGSEEPRTWDAIGTLRKRSAAPGS